MDEKLVKDLEKLGKVLEAAIILCRWYGWQKACADTGTAGMRTVNLVGNLKKELEAYLGKEIEEYT